MRRLVLVPLAVLLAAMATFAGTARADAAQQWPTCARVNLGGGDYRLALDPGTVVTGTVLTVSSQRTQWVQRPNGTWTSTQQIDRLLVPYVHVVIKSDASLFSDRRWSSWVKCRPFQP